MRAMSFAITMVLASVVVAYGGAGGKESTISSGGKAIHCKDSNSCDSKNNEPNLRLIGSDWGSKSILLVADNQEHAIYSPEATGSEWADKNITSVSIRPVVLDLFGSSLVARALKPSGEDDHSPIIHLGDGVDVSCRSELERTFDILDASGRPWLFMLGNHEDSFRGNFRIVGKDDWHKACGDKTSTLGKAAFIESYLKRLEDCKGESCAAPGFDQDNAECTGPSKDGKRCTWEGKADGFLSRIVWLENPENNGANSYLVQEARLDDARIILLDTTFGRYTKGIPTRAWGTVRKTVREIVKPWLKECADDEACFNIIAGHTQYERGPIGLSVNSQHWLRRQFQGNHPPLFYLSAHTHKGWIAREGSRSESFIEVNVPSVVDFPASFGELRFGDPASLETGVSYVRHLLSNMLEKECRKINPWSPQHYLDYRGDQREEGVDVHGARLDGVVEALIELGDHLTGGVNEDGATSLPQGYIAVLNELKKLQAEGSTTREREKERSRYIKKLALEEATQAADLEGEIKANRDLFRTCHALYASQAEAAQPELEALHFTPVLSEISADDQLGQGIRP
jgi:hypothetical protein